MPVAIEEVVTFLKNIHPFRKMDEVQLQQTAGLMKDVFYEKSKIIYHQGEESNHLYIVLSGNIKLSRIVNDEQDENWGVLEPGDIFGFELWRSEQNRLFSATADTDTRILYLDWEHVTKLADEITVLRNYLDLMVEGYFLMIGLKPNWRQPEEAIHFISRVHWPFLLFRLTIPLLSTFLIGLPLLYFNLIHFPNAIVLGLALIVFLVIVGWIIWTIVDWTNDYYILTDQRVINQNRILMLYENRQEAPLNAILAVTLKTDSLLARKLSCGDLVVRTYTGSIYMSRLPNPEQMVSMIDDRLRRRNTVRTQTEKQMRINSVRQRLGLSPVEQEESSPALPQMIESKGPGSFLEWLTSKFQLRSENDGVITYRTHWFLLVKRVWIQSVLIVALVGFMSWYIGLRSLFQIPFWIIAIWCVAFLFILGLWIYSFLDWRNDCFIITEDQVIDISRKPFSQQQKSIAALNNIQSIEYKRIGLFALLFNYGTVYIRIGDEEFTFDNVYNPSSVQRELFQQLQRHKEKDKQAEKEEEHLRILDWIEAYHHATEDGNEMESQSE